MVGRWCQGLQAGVVALLVAAPAMAADAPAKQVTFAKDVAPIFASKCVECHQPNSIAPMSLMTFDEARPWARSIRERVSTHQMPPWHIDKSVGIQKFKNDMSLSDDQIDTIVRWVDAGAAQGDPKDMPAMPKLDTTNEWKGVRDGFGQPDIIVHSAPYTVQAVHQDVWWRPTSDLPITEPRWVKLVEIRPSTLQARKVIHHSIAYLQLNDDADSVNKGTASGGGGAAAAAFNDIVDRRPQLMEWAIGKGYDLYREGTGKLIKPGEKLAWDQHLHSIGEEVVAGSDIGIWLYPKGQEPKHRSYLVGFTGIDQSKGLDIPPNTVAFTEGFTVLKENTVIENFQPHFHLRGKAMEVEAITPDGGHQIVSYVDHFNFNWMTNYIYADDAAPVFPKGTIIHVKAWYDNTVANKNNPDPEQWVGFGDRTVDEMAHAWMNVTYLNEDEYNQLLAERKAAKAKNTQQQQQ